MAQVDEDRSRISVSSEDSSNNRQTARENARTLSCHTCRRRKTKCDRSLPTCFLCQSNGQECVYPERTLKPGPKLGSVQQRGKRKLHDRDSRSTLSQAEQHGIQNELANCDQNDVATKRSPPSSSFMSFLPLTQPNDLHSLSSIIHPSHESCSPQDSRQEVGTVAVDLPDIEPLLTGVYIALGVKPELVQTLVDLFFDTFISFQLFRDGRFWAKICCLRNDNQVHALLASMMMLAVKFWDSDCPDEKKNRLSLDGLTESSLANLAMSHLGRALYECGDDAPPLATLQALILITHYLLTQGVRGRAWRYLGTCVRIAYELDLHLIDAGKSACSALDHPEKWCEDEEKRRAWWAIWEMDVFATVIRRCPTAINWQQYEVFLPAEDERWLQGKPQASCYLEPGLIARCKALQSTENRSHQAWFIVVNSIMKEAQTISSPRSVDYSKPTEKALRTDAKAQSAEADKAREASRRLVTLQNSVHCFWMALPAHLRYQDQSLDFVDQASSAPQHGSKSTRHLHSAIYSIFMMTQLTKLMIHKHHVFKIDSTWCVPRGGSSDRGTSMIHADHDPSASVSNTGLAIGQYFDAADSVLKLIQMSGMFHYRYVNPFIANTIWLACAVQLLRRELASPEESARDLANSNLEVLSMVYEQFAGFWSLSHAPKHNLSTLEGLLRDVCGKSVEPPRRKDRSDSFRQLQRGDCDQVKESAHDVFTFNTHQLNGGVEHSLAQPHDNENLHSHEQVKSQSQVLLTSVNDYGCTPLLEQDYGNTTGADPTSTPPAINSVHETARSTSLGFQDRSFLDYFDVLRDMNVSDDDFFLERMLSGSVRDY